MIVKLSIMPTSNIVISNLDKNCFNKVTFLIFFHILVGKRALALTSGYVSRLEVRVQKFVKNSVRLCHT
jgi:hypothetical protein